MYVITADQIGSRADIDRSDAMRRELQAAFGAQLALPVDQTAGDEVQAIAAAPKTAPSNAAFNLRVVISVFLLRSRPPALVAHHGGRADRSIVGLPYRSLGPKPAAS